MPEELKANREDRHNLNLHRVAPEAFEMMFDFLERQGL